jgi:hypothetical protein
VKGIENALTKRKLSMLGETRVLPPIPFKPPQHFLDQQRETSKPLKEEQSGASGLLFDGWIEDAFLDHVVGNKGSQPASDDW